MNVLRVACGVLLLLCGCATKARTDLTERTDPGITNEPIADSQDQADTLAVVVRPQRTNVLRWDAINPPVAMNLQSSPDLATWSNAQAVDSRLAVVTNVGPRAGKLFFRLAIPYTP